MIKIKIISRLCCLVFSLISFSAFAQTLTLTPTTTGAFKIEVSNVYSWTVQELVNGSWTNLANGSNNTTLNYSRPLGTYTFRLYNCYPTTNGCSYGSSKSISVTKVIASFDSALWRLASRQDRYTLKSDQSTNSLAGGNYLGLADQQWRITPVSNGSSSFKIKNEATQKCLALVNNVISSANCTAVSSGLISSLLVEKLRNRSETQPAIYHVRIDSNRCILPNSTSVPLIGTCNDSARWYIEPVGYGERPLVSTQYDVKALLIVKPTTSVNDTARGVVATGSISQDIINAAQVSFKDNAKYWLERATDGAVTWNADTLVANEPIRSFHYDIYSDRPSGFTWWQNPISGAGYYWNNSTQRFESIPSGFDPSQYGGTNFLPAADKVPNDVQRFVPRGIYDTVEIFFKGGTVPGGWGWGPGRSPQSNYALWTTVNGGNTAASAWLQKITSEPTEVFIHEMMHGLDAHYGPLGVPLPADFVHGSELARYDSLKDAGLGWMHWYRDYWLGTVIAEDDTYRGFGPRMFRLEKVRNFAARQPESTIKITQNSSGKCLSTKNGVTTPAYGTEIVFSSVCNTAASSFKLNSNGMLEFKGSSSTGTGFCVHPNGGTANQGTSLVLWGSCSDAGLPVRLTDYGSIQNIQSSLCVHPSGGSSNPTDGTNAVYWSGCDGDYVRFRFNRQ